MLNHSVSFKVSLSHPEYHFRGDLRWVFGKNWIFLAHFGNADAGSCYHVRNVEFLQFFPVAEVNLCMTLEKNHVGVSRPFKLLGFDWKNAKNLK